MKHVQKILFIAGFVLGICGCFYDSSGGPSEDVKFDRSNSLEKFEGIYDNKPNIDSTGSYILLSEILWPSLEIYPEVIDVHFQSPNFLIVRAFKEKNELFDEPNLMKESKFSEGTDFLLKRGVIHAGDEEREYLSGDGSLFEPMFGTYKRTYELGVDVEGHLKLRIVHNEVVSDLFTGFLPLWGRTYWDVRYERVTY